jgi:hypothetical protein
VSLGTGRNPDRRAGSADLDADSLAAAIDRVLADPPPILEESVQRFAIETVAGRYLALAD